MTTLDEVLVSEGLDPGTFAKKCPRELKVSENTVVSVTREGHKVSDASKENILLGLNNVTGKTYRWQDLYGGGAPNSSRSASRPAKGEYQRSGEDLSITLERLARKYGARQLLICAREVHDKLESSPSYHIPPKGTTIGVRAAADKYGVSAFTIRYWRDKNKVKRLGDKLDEHSVAKMANTPLLRGAHRGKARVIETSVSSPDS